MSEQKRLTATELREQQQERAKAATEEAQKESKAADAARRKAEDEALQKAAEKLKATWYDSVVAASQRHGVGFVVLARTVDHIQNAPPLVQVLEEMKALGYKPEFVSLDQPSNRGGQPHAESEGIVQRGAHKGWQVKDLIMFGGQGSIRYLAVSW